MAPLRSSLSICSATAAALLSLAASEARAEERAPLDTSLMTSVRSFDGAYSPLVQSPSSSGHELGRGFAQISAGYNTITEEETLDVAAQVHLFGRFALVAQVQNLTGEEPRPGIGASAHLLGEFDSGVDLTGYLLYKAEGFSEPEGELELLASLGKTFGAVRGVMNLAYGQDPEGNERDGEVALAATLHLAEPLFAGLAARYRDALGSRGELGVVRDLFAGASATYTIDRFGVSALAGLSEIETSAAESFESGVAASLTVGAAF